MGNTQLQVVIDSTAMVDKEWLGRHENLHVVPLSVRIGEQEWLDTDISGAELFQKASAAKEMPKTSQPAQGQFIQLFQELTARGQEVVCILLSGGLSGTASTARMAAAQVDPRLIRVIDSGTTAIGLVQMAKAALEAAEAGKSLAEVVHLMDAMARRTHTLFIPGTLEYLHKGGRIGGAARLFGGILQLRPLLYLQNGKVQVLDKVRTQKRALERAMQDILVLKRPAYIGVGHVDNPELAAQTAALVKEAQPEAQVEVFLISPVIGAHTGPGLIGFIYQENLEEVPAHDGAN